MKYDLTRIVNESFTIELRLIATNFLRLVPGSWFLDMGGQSSAAAVPQSGPRP